MKLRNKKTGEIVEAYKGEPIDLFIYLGTDEEGDELNRKTYRSIAELNEEWEDYEPKEPLVEKRSHRGVLRAAARLSGTDKAHVCRSGIAEVVLFEFAGKEICSVELKDNGIHVGDEGWYTIAELCGEEEE